MQKIACHIYIDYLFSVSMTCLLFAAFVVSLVASAAGLPVMLSQSYNISTGTAAFSPRSGQEWGPDVSHYQGNVNWADVKKVRAPARFGVSLVLTHIVRLRLVPRSRLPRPQKARTMLTLLSLTTKRECAPKILPLAVITILAIPGKAQRRKLLIFAKQLAPFIPKRLQSLTSKFLTRWARLK
jgi:hypothetical protein